MDRESLRAEIAEAIYEELRTEIGSDLIPPWAELGSSLQKTYKRMADRAIEIITHPKAQISHENVRVGERRFSLRISTISPGSLESRCICGRHND